MIPWGGSGLLACDMHCWASGAFVARIKPSKKNCLTLKDEGTLFLQNVRNHLANNVASHPRRHESSATLLWAPEVLHYNLTFITNPADPISCSLRGVQLNTLNVYQYYRLVGHYILLYGTYILIFGGTYCLHLQNLQSGRSMFLHTTRAHLLKYETIHCQHL